MSRLIRNASAIDVGLKNRGDIGRIERGLVVMGCVLDVVRG